MNSFLASYIIYLKDYSGKEFICFCKSKFHLLRNFLNHLIDLHFDSEKIEIKCRIEDCTLEKTCKLAQYKRHLDRVHSLLDSKESKVYTLISMDSFLYPFLSDRVQKNYTTQLHENSYPALIASTSTPNISNFFK